MAWLMKAAWVWPLARLGLAPGPTLAPSHSIGLGYRPHPLHPGLSNRLSEGSAKSQGVALAGEHVRLELLPLEPREKWLFSEHTFLSPGGGSTFATAISLRGCADASSSDHATTPDLYNRVLFYN